jgi:hypothetical protein
MTRRSSFESRPTQTQRIVGLLRSRSPHWVPLTEILGLRISQYAARIYQARHEWGLNIENRVETTHGEKHSWFRVVERPQTAKSEQSTSAAPRTETFPEFGSVAPERYPD